MVVFVCCSEATVDRDRPRSIISWNFPDQFEPSHISEDEAGNRWGLFVSKRYSGKDNIWAVKAEPGGEWQNPVLLMNAYLHSRLSFQVSSDSFFLEFDDIDDGYFYDYGVEPPDSSEETIVTRVSFSRRDVTRDSDRDGVPNSIENELLLSNRLTDSDSDGKSDAVDFCPLSIPMPQSERYEFYKIALRSLMNLDDFENIQPSKDTAWSRYYGIYYIHEPTVIYLALPGEVQMPELTGLPVIVVQVRNPMYFTSKQSYASNSGGVVPHLEFQRPNVDFLGKKSQMKIRYVIHRYRSELATVHFVRDDNGWQIEKVTTDG